MDTNVINNHIFVFWKTLFMLIDKTGCEHLCEMITYFEPQKPEEYEEAEHLDRSYEPYDELEDPEITPFTIDTKCPLKIELLSAVVIM